MNKSWSIAGRSKAAAERAKQNLVLTPPFPVNLMIELSNACNHACVFCTNPKMTRTKGRIDVALLERILSEAKALGSNEVGFYTTGDPLVHRDLR